MEFINKPTCMKCGAKIDDEKEMFCTRCKNHLYDSYNFGIGLLRYNDYVKESLHRIKYKGRKEYLKCYGKLIAKIYKDEISNMNLDVLIPVPINKSRMLTRNYNQAGVLAHIISNELQKYNIDVPVDDTSLKRIKKTKVLNKLDNESRKQELKGAFKCDDDISYENVAIIDDIYTTGNTINEISNVLKEKGIKNIYFITISVVDNL